MPSPINPEFVQEAELELGLVFPQVYKQKMLRTNGGSIVTDDHIWQMFPIYDRSDAELMRLTYNHVIYETYIARTWPNFPPLAVAIAENGSGDYLVLLPARPDMSELREEVFLWLHETGAMLEIADSVEELW